MALKIMKDRHVGGVEYFQCPECKNVEMTNKPVKVQLPYCSECSKPVMDLVQNYCGYCGIEFED